MLSAWRMACGDLHGVVTAWRGIETGALAEFDALLAKRGMGPITLPGALSPPACGSTVAHQRPASR